MTAREAVELIHQRAWVGQPPGLERTRILLERLDNPQAGLKFVHIAGTNGKGSTAAMTAAILSRAGLRTGLYTSPHLWQFTERFQVNGVPMSNEDLVDITGLVLEAAQEMAEPPTEFELMTAMGMVYFARQRCDLVVLEVGLGGRMDSTNIIPPPEVAAITNIGLEHVELLGDTPAKIAREKGGILKAGTAAVLYHQTPEVEAVIAGLCREQGIPLKITRPEEVSVQSQGVEGSSFTYRGEEYRLALLGEYQLGNALTAIEIAKTLQSRGWPIDQKAISEGLAQARWPGRMELLQRHPDVFVDGGHNPQCISAFRQALEGLYPDKQVIFLTGMLRDKEFGQMLGDLLPIAKAVVTITPDSERALTAEELAQVAQAAGVPATPCPTMEEGIAAAMALAGPEDVVCICGSLYLVGEVRHHFGLC